MHKKFSQIDLLANASQDFESVDTFTEQASARLKKNYANLVDQNVKLQSMLNTLIDSAKQNQRTQEKFFALELFFLESSSFQILIARILNDLKERLSLADVNLTLRDDDCQIRMLIEEIYGELNFPRLAFVEGDQEIKSLYGSKTMIQLSNKSQFIKKIFKDDSATIQSVAILPLFRGEKLVGSLHLASQDASRFTPELATSFLQHLSSIISVCIENAINQERYVHLSLVDLLTRAKNRRFFFQAIAKEISRASRTKLPLACLFLDVDYFKSINDTYGHDIGDLALKEIAKTITPLLRKSDTLARFGGEEFTVLLPETKLEAAVEIAERIRSTIEQLVIALPHSKKIKVTTSIGVSFWTPSTQSQQSPMDIQQNLINAADHAVYQAKQDGRNCVRIA